MGKVIAVISGKGGTGKTTTVAAISSCLAALGHRTLCIDCDAGLRNLDIALCMSEFAVCDFADVLSGKLTLDQAIAEHPNIKNLFFLSAPSFQQADEFDPNEFSRLISLTRSEFDFSLIDSSSGVGAPMRLAITDADTAIIVATGEMSSMRDAQRAAIVASESGVHDLRLLINRVDSRDYIKFNSSLDDVIDSVGVPLIGVVSEDKAVLHAPHANSPLILYPKRRAAFHFLDAARRLAGSDIPIRNRRF